MGTELLFVHSSDELYGADRVLGYILNSLIEAQGVRVDHVPLPILRRANLTPAGLTDLARRSAAFRRHCARLSPATVYGTTSATLPALAALTGAPTRVLLHNQEVWKPKEAQILGRLARNVDRVIAISAATRDSMPQVLQDRTVVVANTTPDPFETPGFAGLAEVPSEVDGEQGF